MTTTQQQQFEMIQCSPGNVLMWLRIWFGRLFLLFMKVLFERFFAQHLISPYGLKVWYQVFIIEITQFHYQVVLISIEASIQYAQKQLGRVFCMPLWQNRSGENDHALTSDFLCLLLPGWDWSASPWQGYVHGKAFAPPDCRIIFRPSNQSTVPYELIVSEMIIISTKTYIS